MLTLFDVMRPNAVALVDAFDFSDHSLESCLGRYDGQVYQALYDYAKMAPMNQTEVITLTFGNSIRHIFCYVFLQNYAFSPDNS